MEREIKSMGRIWSLMFVLGFMMIVLMSNNVSADNEIATKDIPKNLIFTCTLNNSIPSPSTTFNISIFYKNGSVAVNNTQTTAQGQGSFNYTYTFTELGLYQVNEFCYDGSLNYSNSEYIDVTARGRNLTTGQGIVYVVLLIIGIGLFLLSLYGSIALPWSDKRDEQQDKIIEINSLKWLKLVLWFVTYGIFTFLISIMLDISESYLFIEGISNILNIVFIVLISLMAPLAIFTSLAVIWQTITDRKNMAAIERGLPIR